ncbi:hypothetical protein D3C77_686720 [compost metagenome]|jgi:hypothetical protein
MLRLDASESKRGEGCCIGDNSQPESLNRFLAMIFLLMSAGALELERTSIDARSAKRFSPPWSGLLIGTNHSRSPSLSAEIARAIP